MPLGGVECSEALRAQIQERPGGPLFLDVAHGESIMTVLAEPEGKGPAARLPHHDLQHAPRRRKVQSVGGVVSYRHP